MLFLRICDHALPGSLKKAFTYDFCIKGLNTTSNIIWSLAKGLNFELEIFWETRPWISIHFKAKCHDLRVTTLNHVYMVYSVVFATFVKNSNITILACMNAIVLIFCWKFCMYHSNLSLSIYIFSSWWWDIILKKVLRRLLICAFLA